MIGMDWLAGHPGLIAIALALVHFLWQGAIIAAAAALLLRCLSTAAATTRYAAGIACLAAMLAAPVVTALMLRGGAASANRPGAVIARHTPTAAESEWAFREPERGFDTRGPSSSLVIATAIKPSADVFVRGAAAAAGSLDARWLAWILAAWFVGVGVMLVRLLGGWLLARHVARRAAVPVAEPVRALARDVAARLGIRRIVSIVESSAVSVPTLIGCVKPVVLFPAAALAGLSPSQLEAILAHELAHVRRHDYLVNLLQSIVETLLFYHPGVWWVSARVRDEREHCCDDLAVRVCGDRLTYASALAELASIHVSPRVALAATDGSLLDRVRRILGRPPASREAAPPWAALGLVIAMATLAGSFGAAATDRRSPSSDMDGDTTTGSVPALAVSPLAATQPVPPAPPASIPGRFDWLWAEPVPPAPPVPPTAPASPVHPLPPLPPAPPAILEQPQPPQPPLPPAPPALPVAVAEMRALDWGFAPPPPPPPAPPEATQPPQPPDPPDPPPPPDPPDPPEPPEPPQPPDPGVRGRGGVSWSNNGDRLRVEWTGPFRISDDERDIASVDPGARLTISEGWLMPTSIEFRGRSDGTVERRFRRSGFEREYDAEAREWLATTLARIIRETGMLAEQRVARLLKEGGPPAVFNAIDRLGTDSSYVKRRYYQALLAQATPTDELLQQVLTRAAKDLTSDYELASLLRRLVAAPAATDQTRIRVADASRSITSDYEQRRVLRAVIGERATEPVSAAVLTAAADLGSAYERAALLTELARKQGVTASTVKPYVALTGSLSSSYEQGRSLKALASTPAVAGASVEAARASSRIDSDYEQRRVLQAVFAGGMTPEVAAAALQAMTELQGAYERAVVLKDLAARGGVTDQTADAFFRLVSGMSSAYEQRRVLTGIAASSALSDRVMLAMLDATTAMRSDHERAQTLVAIAGRHPLSAAARDKYIDAANDIRSEHEQTRALAALVRSERRPK